MANLKFWKRKKKESPKEKDLSWVDEPEWKWLKEDQPEAFPPREPAKINPEEAGWESSYEPPKKEKAPPVEEAQVPMSPKQGWREWAKGGAKRVGETASSIGGKVYEKTPFASREKKREQEKASLWGSWGSEGIYERLGKPEYEKMSSSQRLAVEEEVKFQIGEDQWDNLGPEGQIKACRIHLGKQIFDRFTPKQQKFYTESATKAYHTQQEAEAGAAAAGIPSTKRYYHQVWNKDKQQWDLVPVEVPLSASELKLEVQSAKVKEEDLKVGISSLKLQQSQLREKRVLQSTWPLMRFSKAVMTGAQAPLLQPINRPIYDITPTGLKGEVFGMPRPRMIITAPPPGVTSTSWQPVGGLGHFRESYGERGSRGYDERRRPSGRPAWGFQTGLGQDTMDRIRRNLWRM